jgi:acetyl esterase
MQVFDFGSSATHSHRLTPAMRSVLSRMARAGHPPLHTRTPQGARAAYEAGADVLEIPRAPLPRVEALHIPARDGAALPARLYSPQPLVGDHPEHLPLLLYLHGGGFTVGSLATHDVLCRELALLAGCIVVSLDYRLAPEHRFPTASNDAWDALQWLAHHAESLGADISRIAVGGDSAGGTLAAVCAIKARNAGLPLALQLLIYPGCSAHQDTPSHSHYAYGLVLEAPAIQWFFAHYVTTPAQREDWRFAPLNAPDVDGVAPAWVGLAECDPLVDEGVDYADKLRAAGVAVDLEIYRGVTHEFIKMGRVIPEARQAHADAARALHEAFGLGKAA